ncbi:MAG TPA: hypothetical protein VJZ78_05190 [Anaerolineales bacterium]|nr:hypothetical protein [Anaerolineales bacterium]
MKRYLPMFFVLLAASAACGTTTSNNGAVETQAPIIFSTATESSASMTPDISVSAMTQKAELTLESQPTRNFQPQGNLIWADNFDNNSSGWYSENENDRISDYFNGGYRMWLDKPQHDIWVTSGQSFPGAISIEVDATKIGGTDDNDFGIICDYQEPDNFHVGLISSDGYTVIAKYQDQSWEYLSSDTYIAVNAINQGEVTNHIRFDCMEGEITL